MNIVEYKKEHIDAFNFSAVAKQFEGACYNKARTAAIAQSGHTWSMLEDGRVLALGGIVPFYDEGGVGEAWFLSTPEALRHGIALHRRVVKLFKSFFDQGWWRIQTTVRADFTTGIVWLDRLGFKDEGLMEKYGPDGSDYIRYARVRGGK
jgi:RimJ/RimL family protein N-acetyltransferase